MANKYKILVVTDHLPWGHRSIAKAIYGFLKDKEKDGRIKVDYAEMKVDTGVGNDIYMFNYRYFPKAQRVLFKLMDKPLFMSELMTDFAVRLNIRNTEKLIRKYKPDLVISCYMFIGHALAKLREEGGAKFKLWAVVSDPWTAAKSCYVPKADMNLVYDKEAVRVGIKGLKMTKDKFLETGWWVRDDMYKEYDRDEVRRKLGFTDDRPVVFVGGGSLGSNSFMKFLPILLTIKKKLGVVINTGTDKMLPEMIKQYNKLLKLLKRDEFIQIKHLGWIDNMAEVLAGVDIVFGKAGPNFLFDVVAAKKPFVAITHVGGQEDGNIDLIRDKKLGWVKEKTTSLTSFLYKYLNDPEKYNKLYMRSIMREAENNSRWKEKVWEEVKRNLPNADL